MKKLGCLLFAAFILCLSMPSVFATEQALPWETEYARMMRQTSTDTQTTFVLADMNFDNTPELIAGNNAQASVYTFQNHSLIKTAESDGLSVQHFANLKAIYNQQTKQTELLGQITDGTTITTYQMQFADGVPRVEIRSTEPQNQSDPLILSEEEEGLKGVAGPNSSYELISFPLCVLTPKEISAATTTDIAIESVFLRYQFLCALSDDTALLSNQQREAIKKVVGEGMFLNFDKISRLDDSHVFVQYYVNTAAHSSTQLPYAKQYALISDAARTPKVLGIYRHESELDTVSLSALKSTESAPSNIWIDYNKAAAFRGIDDDVNYLSTLLSSMEAPINENGKAALLSYMEYAVNRNSRAGIKAKENQIVIVEDAVSFLAENANHCMGRLLSLSESRGIMHAREARAIPELVVSGVDFALPIRIELKLGVANALSSVSGVRLMLDDSHGIYLASSDLSVLEQSYDTFCMEYRKTESGFSVVFTDSENHTISHTAAPVWFIAPAKSVYSTVMASRPGRTDNWGGQFNPQNQTIEFSTNNSGNYDIVENDITINDVEALSVGTKETIRFLVSKDIFTLDKYNRFRPNNTLSRYDFTTALVKMFYAVDTEARCSFTDISEKSSFYHYIASAEAQNIATGYADGTFRGKNPMTKEQVVTLCGRMLVEKKEYVHTENEATYLNFLDSSKISDWAKPYIAVAARCGLIDNSGVFSPAASITRAEGAEILYKTYMLLYDVPPATTKALSQAEDPANSEILAEGYDLEFRIAICILITIIIVFACYILVKVNNRKNKNE